MTVAANDRIKQVAATGGETTLPYDFTVADKTHLVVTEEDTSNVITTLTVDVDYTVNGVGQIGGSTITLDPTLYPSGATAGHIFTLSGDTPSSRTADFAQGGNLPSSQLNQEQDAFINLVQQLERDIARAYALPLSEGETPVTTLPTITDRASKFFAWDASGNVIAAAGAAGPSPVAVSAFMETLLDDATAAAGLTTLGFSAFIQTLIDDADAETARATLQVPPAVDAETATTSGSTSVKSGISANARRITALVENITLNLSGSLELKIGDAGGIETGGYEREGATDNSVSFETAPTSTPGVMHRLTLELIDPTAHTWLITTGAGLSYRKTLSAGPLTQLELSTSQTFAGGGWRIRVE